MILKVWGYNRVYLWTGGRSIGSLIPFNTIKRKPRMISVRGLISLALCSPEYNSPGSMHSKLSHRKKSSWRSQENWKNTRNPLNLSIRQEEKSIVPSKSPDSFDTLIRWAIPISMKVFRWHSRLLIEKERGRTKKTTSQIRNRNSYKKLMEEAGFWIKGRPILLTQVQSNLKSQF